VAFGSLYSFLFIQVSGEGSDELVEFNPSHSFSMFTSSLSSLFISLRRVFSSFSWMLSSFSWIISPCCLVATSSSIFSLS
jgi:hypothetical protein